MKRNIGRKIKENLWKEMKDKLRREKHKIWRKVVRGN